jgi:hypothetical protein
MEFGLDFHPVRFEVCDYDTINILAAQGGFPSSVILTGDSGWIMISFLKAMHMVFRKFMKWLSIPILVMPIF